jgi:soluble lytic murein transglycosylase
VPKDAIALINNPSTPIPTPVRVQADVVNEITYAPDSEQWSVSLREAHRAEDEGRYASAISQYSALVGSADPKEARDALWGLASAYDASGQTDLAIRTYSLFAGLNDPRAVRAIFKLGQLYDRSGRGTEAVQAYEQYAKAGGPAKHVAQLLEASALGNTQGAEDVYKAIVDDKPLSIDLKKALAGWAGVKAARGDHVGARQLYDRLAAEQQKDPVHTLDYVGIPAQVMAAREAQAAGDVSDARKRLLDYLKSNTAYRYGLYSMLDDLLKLDSTAVVSGTIQPMDAANIAYKAGYYGQAIGFMDILRANQPDSPQRPSERSDAALLTGKAFELLGDAASAYNWYTATVQSYTTSLEAPEAAWRAGDALAEQSAWDAALGTYQQAIASYPNAGEETAIARINGAVLAYRLEQRQTAFDLVQPAAASTTLSPTLKAQAAFWAGKVEKSLGNGAWKGALGQVSTLDPGSFLDFRAKALVLGEPDGGPLMPGFQESKVPASGLGVRYEGEAKERTELLSWAGSLPAARPITVTATATVRRTTASATPADVGLEPRLASDAEVQRAIALLNLGYKSEAETALQALAERMKDSADARGLAELVTYLRYHAEPSTAIMIAETLDSIGTGDPRKRPRLLLKTLYPTPYAELVMDEAQLRNVDPLVVYALIRQESRFVPDAHSHADARGLMQVIPSTGAGIADQLGDSRYSVGDLYLPSINIRYGTFYLASNMPQFDRKLLPTLAAYNGGPGNAVRWLSGSALLDPDLYLERIDLFETADYLEQVYTNYGYYSQVYGK